MVGPNAVASGANRLHDFTVRARVRGEQTDDVPGDSFAEKDRHRVAHLAPLSGLAVLWGRAKL